MHGVVSRAKIPLIGRNQSFYSHLQEDSHTPPKVYSWLCVHTGRAVMPWMCHSNVCWALLSVDSQAPAFGGDGKGSWREALGKGNHTLCSAGWVLERSALPEKEGFGNPAANKRQTGSSQSHCKVTVSSGRTPSPAFSLSFPVWSKASHIEKAPG